MADFLNIPVDAFVSNSTGTAAARNDRLDGTVAETIARFGEPDPEAVVTTAQKARALYGDPVFVVLDEPNANLDKERGAVPRHRDIAVQEVTSWV